MGLNNAEKSTCKVKIAKYKKNKIAEKGVPKTKKLDWDNDVHFGVNGSEFDEKVKKEALWGLGPRALDIVNRGGRTAEDYYRRVHGDSLPCFCVKCKKVQKCQSDKKMRFGANLIQVLELINKAETDKWPKENYSDDGNHKILINIDVSGTFCSKCKKHTKSVIAVCKLPENYDQFIKHFKDYYMSKEAKYKTAKTRGISAFKPKGKPHAKLTEMGRTKKVLNIRPTNLYGYSWSKAALERLYENRMEGARIHFHLDGLGDIHDLLAKKGKYSHNVTARELRHIWRNWDRFGEIVGKDRLTIFYNGYNAHQEVIEVEKPWDTDYRDTPGGKEKLKNKTSLDNVIK